MCSIRKLGFIFFAFVYGPFGVAQDNFDFLWEPQIALNYEVAPNYSHNFSIANRNHLYQGQGLSFKVRQLDLVHFSNLKIRDNQSLGLGLQYRFRTTFESGSEDEVRLSQQYNISFRPGALRLGHRFRSEQRFRSSGTVYRFRYRLALDSPLDGEILDVGEPYIVGTYETLLSTAPKIRAMYDQRLELNIGWLLQSGLKIEGGLEYRMEDITRTTGHLLFLTSSLIVSL